MSFRALSLAIVLSAVAASAIAAPPGAPQPGAPMVGGDSDAHGCKASAGYSFSALRNRCIRLWESGIRLDPVTQHGSATMSAFVVFGPGGARKTAELFLPEAGPSVMLQRADDGWTAPGYTLKQKKTVYTLGDTKGRPLYRGQAVQKAH